MFHEISLRNYRTHKDTTIQLGPVTLLIGNNNSGKSNLLAGIRQFAQLVGTTAAADDRTPDAPKLKDILHHGHRLAPPEEPVEFRCSWSHKTGQVEYRIELHGSPGASQTVRCKEEIRFRSEIEDREQLKRSASWSGVWLGEKIQSARLRKTEKQLCALFFQEMAQTFAYHLQPSFLRGEANGESPQIDGDNLGVPFHLGYEGGNLQQIIGQLREKDQQAFERFIASLRDFDRSFHGVQMPADLKHLLWGFKLGRPTPSQLDWFPPEVVSDGLMKAAAIALLTSLPNPPSLIMLEEIENGINPGNIAEFLTWLWQAAGIEGACDRGYATQFILTSHSPAVLREFHDCLEQVYTVHLDQNGYKSDVRNLNESLETLVGIGTLEGRIEERNGKRVVTLPAYKVGELWFSGIIG